MTDQTFTTGKAANLDDLATVEEILEANDLHPQQRLSLERRRESIQYRQAERARIDAETADMGPRELADLVRRR